jgi:hypothetical protein
MPLRNARERRSADASVTDRSHRSWTPAFARDRSPSGFNVINVRGIWRLIGVVLLLSLLAGSAAPAARLVDHGSAVVLDAASGTEIGHVAADGAVAAAVADGHGGWFIGGSFTQRASPPPLSPPATATRRAATGIKGRHCS